MKQLLLDLKQLIEIPSEYHRPEENMPFGKPIDQALDMMLDICNREGFQVHKDPKGYYGYAQIGEGENVFGILCHLDVVPAGTISEWAHQPFEFFQDEDYVYGRGVEDDKGPTLIAFHALVDLLKQDYTLKQPVRFIFGTDEERDWQGIDQYKVDGQLIPIMGFVPDSSFPLTYVEKGVWQFNLIRQGEDELTLNGGVAFNVVPGEAVFDDPSDDLLNQLNSNGFEYKLSDNRVTVIGKNAHAAYLQDGKNALVGLLQALHQTGAQSETARFVAEKLVDGNEGERLFPQRSDDVSGGMTVNLGLVDITPSKQVIGLDIRHPVTIPIEYFREELTKQAKEFGFILEESAYLAPLNVDRESDLVKELMDAYQTVTGDTESEPMISGGATYARSMPNFVAYGAGLKDTETTAHQPNERVKIAEMKLAVDIYQEAFKRLVLEEKK